jgi:hypothetical protein
MVRPRRIMSAGLVRVPIQAMSFTTKRAVTNLGGLALRKVPLKRCWTPVVEEAVTAPPETVVA